MYRDYHLSHEMKRDIALYFRRRSLKMIRSQSMSLQFPMNADWIRSLAVSPFLSSSSTCSSVPESCPDYQRVTISGDYCAGVSRSNKTILIIQWFHMYSLYNQYIKKIFFFLNKRMSVPNSDYSGWLRTGCQRSVQGPAYTWEILKASLS